MLRGLDIRDMLIIDRLSLDFQPGLNVLTGETGAGKSILLDSLGFVLGWRGRADLVREGAEEGEVTAVFELSDDHPALSILSEAGYSVSSELILRRINHRDGRKTAFVNDRRATGELLRALGEVLIELHGQHDDRGLLNARGHRGLLDDFGRLGSQQKKCRIAWTKLQEAQAELAQLNASIEKIRADEEFLRHAEAELAALGPEIGEDPKLDARRRMMQSGARLREDVAKAVRALGLEGAEGQLNDATRWIEDGAGDLGEAATDALTSLGRAMTELGEAQGRVLAIADDLVFDPGELEAVEERLFAIRGLARKHGVTSDDLPKLAAEFQKQLAELDTGAGQTDALQAAVSVAAEEFQNACERLTEARTKAAQKLNKSMAKELTPLKLERAKFETTIEPREPGPAGADHVHFQVSTNPGSPAGPLNRIASGGELSRFMLALKVCLSGGSEGKTLIFDEIDRGVGGATADAVGRRLARLSDDAQVLVVTHSPQVAALGRHHWRVEKLVSGKATLSQVEALDSKARVAEIARMLSGETVTKAAREAAKALLAR